MRLALQQAARAARNGEPPIGAVVVKDGVVVGRGYNQRELRQDATLHAEILAIRSACRRLASWRLDDCDLYVTLEPCPMCAGAIQQARIRTLRYGATDPKAGAVATRARVLDTPGLAHVVRHEGGLLAAECRDILQAFFRDLRMRDRAEGSRGTRRKAALDRQVSRQAGAAPSGRPEEPGPPAPPGRRPAGP